jgi:pimeloyl-ACP methyl ester carboxylesterase
MELPETRYARSGDVSIAYQAVGEGPFDVVFIPGFVSHVELGWSTPPFDVLWPRLASNARLIVFDKRGTGMSDRVAGAPTLETRMDDVRAVMDAVGSARAAIVGISEGAPMSILFAATCPGRATALVLIGGFARLLWAPDYPWVPRTRSTDVGGKRTSVYSDPWNKASRTRSIGSVAVSARAGC